MKTCSQGLSEQNPSGARNNTGNEPMGSYPIRKILHNKLKQPTEWKKILQAIPWTEY